MAEYKRHNSGAYLHCRHEFDRLSPGLTGLQRGPAL